MIEIKAPNKVPDNGKMKVFLAGSIEMGTTEKWQDRVIKQYGDYDDVIFLNPRREDWDSSWKQTIKNKQFKEQVNWEADGIEESDLVIFYFDPETKSPITLLEFGFCLGAGLNMIVVCPEGFWRRGNIEVMCDREDVPLLDSLDTLFKQLKMI